jgi:hypothetical protein
LPQERAVSWREGIAATRQSLIAMVAGNPQKAIRSEGAMRKIFGEIPVLQAFSCR